MATKKATAKPADPADVVDQDQAQVVQPVAPVQSPAATTEGAATNAPPAPGPEEEQSMSGLYIVHRELLERDGQRFVWGEDIPLTDEQAKPLLALGAIAIREVED